jgi:KipI family sensor histidine kinase inhibitor
VTERAGSAGVPRIVPFGDAALLVVFGDHVDRALNAAVHRLARVVRDAGRPWSTPVPGYASLLVPYDELEVGHTEASAAMARLIEAASRRDAAEPSEDREAAAPLRIDVRYGGEKGPDLVEVAERAGLSPADVVDLHASTTYVVFMLGFVPGFAYLGPLTDRLALPRRSEPRTRVPAGSVAIAERQTAVYPFETPGGWHLIGRTDARLWDPRRTPPTLLAPGATVRFRPATG